MNVYAWVPAGMGKGGGVSEGECPSLEMLYSVLCITSYSKTLSRPIIYALFSQSFVGFWRFRPQALTLAPPLDSIGRLSSPDPLICPPVEKSCGHPCMYVSGKSFRSLGEM